MNVSTSGADTESEEVLPSHSRLGTCCPVPEPLLQSSGCWPKLGRCRETRQLLNIHNLSPWLTSIQIKSLHEAVHTGTLIHTHYYINRKRAGEGRVPSHDAIIPLGTTQQQTRTSVWVSQRDQNFSALSLIREPTKSSSSGPVLMLTDDLFNLPAHQPASGSGSLLHLCLFITIILIKVSLS